jgi:hypothetical protein
MNIILFNFGKNKPYFKDCISQIRKYNQKIDIFFIGNDRQYIEDADFYDLKYLHQSENLKAFNKLDFYVSHENPLWSTSMARFFYIEEFIKRFNLKDVFHFDNDVLIYESFLKILNKIENKEKNIFTPSTKFALTCGLFYTRNYHSIYQLNEALLIKASEGINLLNQKYFSSRSLPEEPFMVNEMTILKIIEEENDDLISIFPITPDCKNYNRYDFCFDPSSWGQYLGGTPNVGAGWAGNHHIIGQEIIKNKYKPFIEDNKPKVLDLLSGNVSPLFNLHIHSKKLNNFI